MSSPKAYKVPIVDLRAQYRKLRAEVRLAIDEVLESQQFILGPVLDRFEAAMARYLRCEFTVGVASGSDALLLALIALDVGPGDGVIVTPFTFFSTVSAITRLGARPLFVDIEPESCLLSAAGVARFLDRQAHIRGGAAMHAASGTKIKALVAVHLFGQCCAMAELVKLAEKYSVAIVEDVAQACGARMNLGGQEKFAGTIGALGCFSFFPSKILGAFGDGGLVSTNSQELVDKIRLLRVHGESSKYHHQAIGLNSRLDALQAAVLSVKQRYVEQWCEQRSTRAQTYRELFTENGLVSEDTVLPPAPSSGKSHVFNYYVIRAARRDALKSFLDAHGIQSEIYYPLPLHLQPCFAFLGHRRGDFPQAEGAAQKVLALPLYPELTDEQQRMVVEAVRSFYEH